MSIVSSAVTWSSPESTIATKAAGSPCVVRGRGRGRVRVGVGVVVGVGFEGLNWGYGSSGVRVGFRAG